MSALRGLFAGELPQLVMFDLDGTLVDSVPDIATATDTMLTSLGVSAAGEAKVRGWVGNGAATLVARALKDAGLDADNQTTAMTLWRAAYTLCCTRQTRLYPGASELLAALQNAGCRLALTTNKPIQFARPLLEHLGINARFDWVLGGECVPEKKPAPHMLLEVMRDAGIGADASLMVGDSSADIGAARAAGVKVAAVTFGYDNGNPVAGLNPDLLVDGLVELLP
ncbi:phosphoglycolate phosphatase [Simiduia agarivorans]|uniref:Phosphoglycolate phosphatase n=1 Tax=Simiduia agarivorans (strain DSM 21679 / JCM 13881 / BCRC 17597 / SA1) TaxID=1117647 RepID=K4KPR2_SIMAS|nr:phosphoglycolate phosphatase [Simiduia agarivorans]AFV00226.1 phosphoglycolate phosphatase [Simiduia agarivorans SA1 = DSM 21679]